MITLRLARNRARRPSTVANGASALEVVRFRSLPSGSAMAEDARLGRRVVLGRNVTLYPGVTIADDCTILDGTVIGRVPLTNGTTTRPVASGFGRVKVGEGSIIGCNAVLYTDTELGRRVLIGDLACLREGCRLDDGVVLGRGVMALYNCSIGRM